MRPVWVVLAAASVLCVAPGARPARADNDDFEKVGDWILYTLPPASLAYSAYRERNADPNRWDGVLQGGIGLGSTIGLTQALKAGTNRKRPDFEPGDDRDSFPSGHTVGTVTFYALLFFLIPTVVTWPPLRWALQTGCLLMVLAAGPARVYIGVHWPSDVLGGYLVALLFLAPVLAAYRARDR